MPSRRPPPILQTLLDLPTYISPLLSRLRTRKFLFLLTSISCVLFLFYVSSAAEWSSARLGSFSSRLGEWSFGGKGKEQGKCTPAEYASGRWVRRPYWTRPGPLSRTDPDDVRFTSIEDEAGKTPNMTKPEDILDFARFGGCASSREFWWHLAVDREEQWGRFPGAVEWEWVPGGRCGEREGRGLREWVAEEVVRDLVERGGWLLIGDSVTENHFFSLSCLLYPHVVATPDYTKHEGGFDRAWPQHLYLNPNSPLLQNTDGTVKMTKHKSNVGSNAERKPLRFPVGFNASLTPLVTFRRVDVLYTQTELRTMHRELHPEIYKANPEFQLFGDEAVWTMGVDEYLDIFTGALPTANYRAMVVSTAGHWTTGLFRGYRRAEEEGGDAARVVWGNETEISSSERRVDGDEAWAQEVKEKAKQGEVVLGYDGLLTFFGEVMERWAGRVQERVGRSGGGGVVVVPEDDGVGKGYPPSRQQQGGTAERQVVVRAYLPGHEDCHSHREAWSEIVPFKWNWYNWGEIWKYNRIFENVVRKYTNVHFLGIDRPGRLRPDAHASGDCLHIMSGAGVLEGWSHYIWHYLTREV